MKKIYNLIMAIVLISVILIIYFNLDTIVDKIKTYFVKKHEIVLETPNKYKRDYSVIHLKNFEAKEDYIPYNKEDIENIIYNVLNNGYESFTFYCPKEYTNCKDDVAKVSESKVNLSNISNYVSPFNSYKNISTKVYVDGKAEVKVTKTYSKEDIKNVNNEIDRIMNELNLKNLSKKQQITKIHDYVVGKTKYDKLRSESGESNFASNKASGTLLEGYAICSGFSDTMALFLDRLEIPNFKVASEKHVWNLAYIDGKWLHIDLTWDLPFEGKKDVNHTFLLINTNKLESLDTSEHSFDKDFYVEAN